MTRHSGSANPCPVIDFDAGFNAWMAYAYGLPKGTTVADKFGKPFGKSPHPMTAMLFGQMLGIMLQMVQSAKGGVSARACLCLCVCVFCVSVSRPAFLHACVLIGCFGCRPLFE